MGSQNRVFKDSIEPFDTFDTFVTPITSLFAILFCIIREAINSNMRAKLQFVHAPCCL